jgi:hypothetical protein
MNDKLQLLIDCCQGGLELCLNESTTGKKLTTFRGKFQEAEAINKNKRRYPFGILDENVQNLIKTINSRGLVGELDHPTDSIIHFEKASHVITKLWWEGKVLMGEGEILTTPHGHILRNLIENGVRVGISSRGIGTGKLDENGVLVIGESYKLITFDAVADPSTHEAFQEKVKKENNYVENEFFSTNLKPASINKVVSKDALIACLGGLIQEKSKQLKSNI